MKTALNFIAFPEDIIEQKSVVKLEALYINLPPHVIEQLDYAIGQINKLPKTFFITYRITESNLHQFAKLLIMNSTQQIEIVHLQLQAQKNLLMAHIFANIGDIQDQYWFVELKNYKECLEDQ